jgi:rare lipoprotein A
LRRRRFALIAAFLSSGAFAVLPSTVASGDATGGSSAPGGGTSSGQTDTSGQSTNSSTPPPAPPAMAATPGHPALEPPSGAVVQQDVMLNGAVHKDDAGRPVVVQQRTDGGQWADVGTKASGSDGSFSVTWTPEQTGKVALRAVLADAQGAQAASADPELDVTVYRPVRATWYGPGDYGDRTACGQRLAPTTLGVAHRRLPCGTQVTLFYNGQSITVPVIDRGPYANGASFDLTKATADKLGADGVFRVGYAIIPA